jgi:serine/threonine protein kinase
MSTDILIGIVFWRLIVGGSSLPFEGGPSQLLTTIVQTRPRPVYEVRRDVPRVISSILEKLLSKQPDSRYNSADGLLADLTECQTRLNISVNNENNNSAEVSICQRPMYFPIEEISVDPTFRNWV